MQYTRYFCGDYDGVIISEEEYLALKESGKLYTSDTVDYEPIFDGKIYPTQSESAWAQIKAFGYQYDDDSRVKGLPRRTQKDSLDNMIRSAETKAAVPDKEPEAKAPAPER